MRKILLISSLMAGFSLTGCNPVTRLTCPPLVTYSPAFQKQAAKELPQAGPNVQTLVVDYGKTRDACRSISDGKN